MVFTARIDSDTRAKVFYLRNVKGCSTRKVAELCDVCKRCQDQQRKPQH